MNYIRYSNVSFVLNAVTNKANQGKLKACRSLLLELATMLISPTGFLTSVVAMLYYMLDISCFFSLGRNIAQNTQCLSFKS
jgi:hypothetical protein